MEKLVFLIQGPRRSARLHLEGPFFVVGRAEPFPVFHDDPTLSREHAAVVDTPEGYRLKDLGSRNGVVLNGEKLARYAEVPLAAGDVFSAGDTRIALVTLAELEAAKAKQQEAETDEPITVDATGQTGYMPALSAGPDDSDLGEVTSALERPGELILDPGGSGLGIPAHAPDGLEDSRESLDALDEEEAETLAPGDFEESSEDEALLE